ncbi:hypothetical protein BB559_001398 [Furculomyces boomerangus]|uniref:Metal resistance protein YCF1 n=1 Tax=Furculomyces boomerangus TaxID=61424 RepID=A0A2T9YGH2_9FUNG|nr:hypothetical protein BB559_004152 [Furculomyces boomerangus]PVU98671.1 hypothetical protein BB559_001398 [Furculomyces boomerangus]
MWFDSEWFSPTYCPNPEGWGPFGGSLGLDFTLCFEHATFLLSTQLFMLTFGSFILSRLIKIQSTYHVDSKNRSFVFKMVLTSISLILCLVKLFTMTREYSGSPVFNSIFAIKLLQMVTLIECIFLSFYTVSRTKNCSKTLQLYWLLSFGTSASMTLTTWRQLEDKEPRIFFLVFILETFVFGALSASELFLINSSPYSRANGSSEEYNDRTISEENYDESIEEKVNVLSMLTFWWMSPMIKMGSTRKLKSSDMWQIPKTGQTKPSSESFWENWQYEVSTNRNSLVISLFKSFGGWYMVSGVLKMFYDTLQFAKPLLLKKILDFTRNYYSETPDHPYLGIYYAFAMLLASVIQTLILHQYFNLDSMAGLGIRSGLITTIYRKTMLMSSKARNQFNAGDIVNRMSVDTQRIANCTDYGHLIWSSPFQICIALYLLYQTLGKSALLGILIMILAIPLNVVVTNRMQELQEEQMKNKDKRIRLTEESLQGIKILKLYAWEDPFLSRIRQVRNLLEIDTLRKFGYMFSLQSVIVILFPFLVTLATFAVYLKFDGVSHGPLNSDLIFVSVSLFNMLHFPLIIIPYTVTLLIEGAIGIRRIREYLISENLKPSSITRLEYNRHKDKDSPVSNGKSKETGSSKSQFDLSSKYLDTLVSVENADFWWDYDTVNSNPILKDISFSLKSNELLAVVGKVGSGKSSLLMALLGEMYKSKGSVTIKGSVAFATQQPWIMNATVRENVLFGLRYDPKFYKRVIFACGLEPDLKMLSNGDMTEIGEKGINLSGGQKARLSLARAVYARADVYLLDDPLAAVDAHVGSHLFKHVLGPNGLLKTRARVLITNAIPYLEECDTVLLMQSGYIVEQGDYNHVLNNRGLVYSLVRDHGKQAQTPYSSGVQTPYQRNTDSKETKIPENLNVDFLTGDNDQTRFESSPSFVSDDADYKTSRSVSIETFSKASVRSMCPEINLSDETAGQLIAEETSETGQVNRKIYWDYIKSCGIFYFISFIIAILISEGLYTASFTWLRFWAASNDRGEKQNIFYMSIYLVIGVAFTLFAGARSYILLTKSAVRSAKINHEKLISSVFRSPMEFFDTTPLGRILNRFSKDIATLDEELPQSFNDWLVELELKRLDSVSKSPIYQHFQETLGGVSTIRSFNQTERFIFENEYRVDINQRAMYVYFSLNRWIAIRLEVMSAIMIFFIVLICVSTMVYYKDSSKIDAGVVGMTITYAFSITHAVNWCIRMYCKVETDIVSLERIGEYSNLKPEAPIHLSNEISKRIQEGDKKNWPEHGKIDFINYSTKYREGLEPVLKNITLSIKPGEKIGVVGRTGAGKSSFTLGLFRIIEPTEGKIVIDGVDITEIGLSDLRSRISIIPQDPVLFSGTVRYNLDPSNQGDDENTKVHGDVPHKKLSDEELWEALELANIKPFIKSLEGGLDANVLAGGENFSVGQKQLMCLARAIVKKTQIIVLDEATAAIDPDTDKMIQNTIRDVFKNNTIITIAHRLNTVMDSDRILVLSQGQLVEFDSPENLLKDPNSAFASFANEFGVSFEK